MIRSFLRHPLVYNLLIVLATFVSYKIARSGIIYPFSRQFIDVLIFVSCVVQIFYFVVFSLRKLFFKTGLSLSYGKILIRICGTILFILLTFTVNYWCLFDNNPSAISGLSNSSLFRELLDMFYFSCVTFATVGYGDILPESMAAKSCVILEMATAFFIVVFILSNVSLIMNSVKENMADE
ncbi:MAG: two pore domain potassium channel family protein [Chitinophagaceae bacterium]|nr:two pore domain potassium channel family protein [Chitinophagaceae bacterium]